MSIRRIIQRLLFLVLVIWAASTITFNTALNATLTAGGTSFYHVVVNKNAVNAAMCLLLSFALRNSIVPGLAATIRRS